ncbi:MAG TPA: low temperature requirement protein A [Propionibacteriaceae bacterium]|nr:low temperature requirement protein A [Propionibacteriaceae bacterium]
MSEVATAGPEPLIRPPKLDVGRKGGASPLELFFDLAYVLVVLELAKDFYGDLTWHGFLVMAGLFVTIWFSWVGFTLYANRFNTDDVIYRLTKLAATGAIAGCGASASDAVGKYAVQFAACFLIGRVLLLALYFRAWRHVSEARPTIRVYLLSTGVSVVLWAVSLGVPGDGRYWLWGAAVLVDALGPVLATIRRDRLPLHIEHLPERFGLLIILVLGEALGGAARGVHDASWAGRSLAIGLVGLVVASSLWWIYFDVASAKSTQRLEQAAEDDEGAGDAPTSEPESPASDERHTMFVYGHLPLAFGTVMIGVSLEDFTVHVDTAGDWVLAAGLSIFFAGVALIVAGTSRTWRSVWPWPLAFIPAFVVAPLLPFPNAISLIATYAIALLALAVHGTLASRQSQNALSASR